MTTDQRAKELLEEVLDAYANRSITNQIPLSEMLDNALKQYDDDMAIAIESQIGDVLSDAFTKSIPSAVVQPVQLSDLLYNNSDQVARETMEILKVADKVDQTAGDLAKKIYDGYDSGGGALDVVDNLPQYLQDYMDDNRLSDKFMDQVSKLSTKPLGVANKELAYAIEQMNEDAIEKALQNVLEEKARYYADRIAKTEIQRAKELSNAQDMLKDPNIQYVKWELSGRHKIFDICDYYHRLDQGYGAGIYKVGTSPMIPLHPFCMCKVVPYYKKIKKRKIKDPTKELMAGLTLNEQRAIAGSWDNLNDYMTGTPLIEILNNARPKYPLIAVKDVLGKKAVPPIVPITPTKPPAKVIPPIQDFVSPLKIDPKQTAPLFKDTDAMQYPNLYTKDIIAEAKEIIRKYKAPTVINMKKGKTADSYYSRTGTYLQSELNDHTFLHEYGHHIDQMMGREITGDTLFSDSLSQMTATKKAMYEAMIDDMKNAIGLTSSNWHEKLDPLIDSWFTKERMYYKRGRNKGLYKGTRKIPKKQAYRAFSDIVDSMLSGRFQKEFYTFGHGTRYYKRMDNRLAENFANLFAVWAKGSEWKEAKKMFPAMTKQFEDMMKGK